jgi:hypothetical protein
MGLNIYRKAGQQLLLTVEPGTAAEQLLEQLQAGITIRVCEIQKKHALIGVSAPMCLKITRPEKCFPAEWVSTKPRPPLWRRILQPLWQ